MKRFTKSLINASGITLFVVGMIVLVGCGGGGAGTNHVPSISLKASPTIVIPGGSATLSWTTNDIQSITSSNFGAVGITGKVYVGPIYSTTKYVMAGSGKDGLASGTVTVAVQSGTTSVIPSPSVVFTSTLDNGTSNLFYMPTSSKTPIFARSLPVGVTFLNVDLTGKRLIVAHSVSPGGNQGVYLTDLDGVSNPTRMASDSDTGVMDASMTSKGNILVAWVNNANTCYADSGVKTGTAVFSMNGSRSGTMCASPDGAHVYYPDMNSLQITEADLPAFSNSHHAAPVQGSSRWLRISPDGNRMVYTDNAGISVITPVWGNFAYPFAPASTYPTSGFPSYTPDGKFIFFSQYLGFILKYDIAKNVITVVCPIFVNQTDARIVVH